MVINSRRCRKFGSGIIVSNKISDKWKFKRTERGNICNFNSKINDQNENLLAFYVNDFEYRGAETNFRNKITDVITDVISVKHRRGKTTPLLRGHFVPDGWYRKCTKF